MNLFASIIAFLFVALLAFLFVKAIKAIVFLLNYQEKRVNEKQEQTLSLADHMDEQEKLVFMQIWRHNKETFHLSRHKATGQILKFNVMEPITNEQGQSRFTVFEDSKQEVWCTKDEVERLSPSVAYSFAFRFSLKYDENGYRSRRYTMKPGEYNVNGDPEPFGQYRWLTRDSNRDTICVHGSKIVNDLGQVVLSESTDNQPEFSMKEHELEILNEKKKGDPEE